jgi:hypothetical protein
VYKQVLDPYFIGCVKQLTAWKMYTEHNGSGVCTPFCLIISESQDVWGKYSGHKICIPFFSMTFLENIFCLDSNAMNYTCTQKHSLSSCQVSLLLFSLINKLECVDKF